MAILKAFGKSEDAAVAASLLESEGIDATVIDDSAYGGNVLGATQDAIRIEVPDDQLERATQILAAAALPGSTGSDPGPRTALQLVFRKLVVINLVGYVILLALGMRVVHEPDEDGARWIASLSKHEELWPLLDQLYYAYLALILVSSILLFLFERMGKTLFIGGILLSFVISAGLPPVLLTAFGATVGGLVWMLSAAVITLMFVPEVDRAFRH